MKAAKVLTYLVFASLVGCSDHQDHLDQQKQADSSQPATHAADPVKPQMSMKPTDARMAMLKDKATDCNIEAVNQNLFEPTIPTVSVADSAKVSGWLIDTKQKVVPKDVLVRVESYAGDKAWEQPVTSWGDRGDIVTTHDGVIAYQKSGFNVQLDLGGLAPGSYNIYMIYGPAGSQTACAVGRRFNLK